ncbi:MAG: hypothetical protein JW934_16285 [Anaerolineae bacterium]|nr:hypothetical protein [Anaerolineae bacterium]
MRPGSPLRSRHPRCLGVLMTALGPALYPSQTDEKRWVDGVLARKKGLGF